MTKDNIQSITFCCFKQNMLATKNCWVVGTVQGKAYSLSRYLLNPKDFGWPINWQPCARLMACLSTFFPMITGLSYPDKSNVHGVKLPETKPCVFGNRAEWASFVTKTSFRQKLVRVGLQTWCCLNFPRLLWWLCQQSDGGRHSVEAVIRTDFQVWILSRKILASGYGAGGFSLLGWWCAELWENKPWEHVVTS